MQAPKNRSARKKLPRPTTSPVPSFRSTIPSRVAPKLLDSILSLLCSCSGLLPTRATPIGGDEEVAVSNWLVVELVTPPCCLSYLAGQAFRVVPITSSRLPVAGICDTDCYSCDRSEAGPRTTLPPPALLACFRSRSLGNLHSLISFHSVPSSSLLLVLSADSLLLLSRRLFTDR